MSPARFFLACAAALLGACASAPPLPAEARLTARFHLENQQGQGVPAKLPRSGITLGLNPQPVVTEGDIINVELVQVDLGRCLMFQVSNSAARDLYRMTGSNQGRRLVLFLDGVALGVRRIDGPITDGVLYCFVEVEDEALPGLVEKLRRTTEHLQRELRKKG